jgi:trimeric autotransporter adhesin
VLLVAVALVAMILAILPGVANAAANLDGKVDAVLNGDGGGTNKGDGSGDTNESDGGADGGLKGDVGTGDDGGDLGDTADRALNSDTTADSVTDADQQVNLNDQPQVDGATFSNTELNNPAVPASGEAKADGNGELDGPVGVNEGVCVSGAVNESAGDCGGASGSLGDTVATPDINGNLADTTADSNTTIDENVNPDNLQQVGAVDNTNDVDAPAVPASSTANLDANVTEGDTLNQNASSCTDLNAAGCSGDAAPAPDSGAGIDLGDAVGSLDDTTADSDTTIDQQANNDPMQSDGNITSNTDVDASAVPASAKAELDANGTLGNTIDQDGSVCGSVNTENCGSAAPAPGSEGNDINLSDPVSGLDGTNVNSATTIDENVNPDNPMLDGAADNTNDLVAPAVPASGTANIDGSIADDDLASQGVNSCTDLNAASCGNDAAPDSGAGIDLDDPVADLEDATADSDTTIDENVNPNEPGLDGTVGNTNDIVAPAVPASGTAELDANVTEGDTLNQNASSCTDLNAAGCGGDAAPAPGSSEGAGIELGELVGGLEDTTANSDTTIDENVNPNESRLDGTVDNASSIVAPAAPASSTANLNDNVGVGDTLNQDVSSCTDLNAAGCGDDPAPVPDTGNSTGIDLGESFADLGDTTASSNTTIGQQANDEPLQSNGNTIGNADVVAPAVPASATAELNGIVTEGDTLNQGASFCGTLNAAGCGDAAASPDSGAGIDLGDPVANLGANAVLEGGATLGANTSLSGDAATPAGSDDVLSGDARATLSGDAALSSDAEPISSSSDAAFSGDAVLSGDVDTAPASDDAMTTISDSVALNSGAGSAPAGDDTTLGVDAALSSDAGATLSSDTGTPADSSAAPSGDARTALSGYAESVPAGSDTVPAGDDSPISLSDFLSDEVDTPLIGSSDATLANGDSGTSLNSDAGTAPAGRNDESLGKLALANTTTDTTAGSSGEPASTADPSDNRTQNLAAGPSKSRFRTLAGSPFSDWSVALAAGPFVGEGKASASSGSATKSGDRLLDTGGVSSLVLIAALLFIGSGILLVTKRRRFNS